MEVRSSDNETDISVLRASHEEADTRVILHCHHIRCDTAAVLASSIQISCYFWLHIHLVSLALTCGSWAIMSGTSKNRKYFNIKAVYGSSPISMPLQAVAQRHSFRHNYSTLRVFCQRYDLLFSEGEGELNEAKVKIEKPEAWHSSGNRRLAVSSPQRPPPWADGMIQTYVKLACSRRSDSGERVKS